MNSRQDNSIDFWRGLALIIIFVDHVPGNVFSSYTLHRVAFCDAAELFVFLAGWSLSHATGGPLTPQPAGRVVIRLVARAVEIYRAQIVLTAMALAMLAATALLRNDPIFLEWHNAGPAFFDSARTTIGWVMLTHHLGFFDILPLYVVILLMAPVFVILGRWHPWVALVASLTLYCATLVFNLKLPTWPGESGWYFNPLAWQLLLVLGFLGAEASNNGERGVAFAKTMNCCVPGALVLVAMFAGLTLAGFDPDPLSVPEPRFFFLIDKTNLSPSRVISLLALVIALHKLFPMLQPHLGKAGSWLCSLGRNSLSVFAIGSLLSLVAQLSRFILGGSLTIDVITLVCGLVGMGWTVWFVEWRSRSPSSPLRLS
jgi:hypothetical protein